MTKLPSEAFLPSGAVDPEMSWPQAINHNHNHNHRHLTHNHTQARPHPHHLPHPHPYPLTNGSSPAALAPHSLDAAATALAAASPSGARIYEHVINRSAFSRSSLSPTPTAVPAPPIGYTSYPQASSLDPSTIPRSPGWSSGPIGQSPRLSPSIAPGLQARSSLSRSVSADAAAPQQTSLHLVQRLAQQNSLIREAWEAERNYLEANRRRAEEVYQEERAIMEDVRDTWETERAAMLAEMQTLKERIQRLEGENTTLRAVATQAGVVSPMSSQTAASSQQAVDASSSTPTPNVTADRLGLAARRHPQNPAMHVGSTDADASLLPPGLDGASRRPHFASPGGSRMSPTGQPEFSPFLPLEPRTQPENSSPHDFLSSSSEDIHTPIAVIDVQEIDPKLEGIPIKATAVQKPTFAEPDASSPATSPPPAEAPAADDSRPMPFKRASFKEQTLQVLAAEESRRLTMHAGHTPNHSLSLFPTMSATDAVTSEGATPTVSEPQGPSILRKVLERAHQVEEPEEAAPEHPSISDPKAPLPLGAEIDPEPHLDPTDDVPLKGPLMVKNIPAQDEIFWAQVNKKLEPISQGHDALPTVVRAALAKGEQAGPSNSQPQVQHIQQVVAPVGGDASHDVQQGQEKDEDDAANAQKPPEVEVPLKFKTTTNFGAPFGVA